MTGIPEHDAEEEREGDYGVEGRVGLAVRGHTVGVNEVLEAPGEPVRAVERRRVLVRVDDVQE